ncbi:MAG: phospholipase D-like domain-containing protein, partial [Massilia sp.]
EYQPTMFHVKALVVDSLMVSVGSTNFDNRSFSINDAANLNVIDATFAKAQREVFDDDWARAKPITLLAWEQRGWKEKVGGQLASLIGAQL